MKTNKFYITLWVIISILLIWYVSVDAKWQNSKNWENISKTQKQSVKNEIKSSETCNIENIAKSSLTVDEENALYYQYNEEKVAYDLYTYFSELYGEKTFLNISTSESKHMEAVKTLLDRYSLEVPTDFWSLSWTYNTLKLEWEKSLQNALEVWIKVEILDIEDIVKTIKLTDNDDLKVVFINIGWASYNHLKWFVNWLEINSLTTNIDYSNYLTSDEINIKGSLKDKLVEKLENEWVILNEVIKSNIWNWNHRNSWNNNHNWKWMWKWGSWKLNCLK